MSAKKISDIDIIGRIISQAYINHPVFSQLTIDLLNDIEDALNGSDYVDKKMLEEWHSRAGYCLGKLRSDEINNNGDIETLNELKNVIEELTGHLR